MSVENKASKPHRHSLERELKGLVIVVLVSFSALFGLLAYYSEMPLKILLTLYTLALLLLVPYLWRLYRRIVNPMNNLTNVIEAIRLEDYGLSPRVSCQHGVMAQLFTETQALVELLQQRKARYNQQVYLIYRLIEQLELPVMVFDENLRLTHGNKAFERWHGRPWSAVRGLPSNKIGLVFDEHQQWRFTSPEAHQGWQLKHSRFETEKDAHRLVILNNIHSEVRQVQEDAWQQIIRVLSHEIRNSLTPICSLTDLILDMPALTEELKTPLQVIENRSNNLLQFVERYADTARPVTLRKQVLNIHHILSKICLLFADNEVIVEGDTLSLEADPVLLEQVLINLIRNAIEAHQARGITQPISVSLQQSATEIKVDVKDRGKGIANLDNLFVPFYTTKKGGQGVGLVLCRKIIEQHNGRLTLVNREGGGAVATIIIPR